MGSDGDGQCGSDLGHDLISKEMVEDILNQICLGQVYIAFGTEIRPCLHQIVGTLKDTADSLVEFAGCNEWCSVMAASVSKSNLNSSLQFAILLFLLHQ